LDKIANQRWAPLIFTCKKTVLLMGQCRIMAG
jgi:hypothetical protein